MPSLAARLSAAWLVPIALACSLLLCLAAPARAEGAIDVGKLRGGVSVPPRAVWFLDLSGSLTLDQVRSASAASAFAPTGGEVALGLQEGALWLRFRALNRSDRTKSWLLELSYPHLDYVTLYVVRRDGSVQHFDTGDMVPFSRRPIAQPNFLFPLENGPGETVDVYLRVATTGTLSMPLSAWEVPEYLEHQGDMSVALWMFLGALLMMAVYNAAVWILIRQGEYLTQALLLVAACATALTFNGMMFQYVLPNQPLLANRAIGLFMILAVAASMLTCSKVAARVAGYAFYERVYARGAALSLLAALVVVCVPKELGLRLAMLTVFTAIAGGMLSLILLTRRKHPQLRLYLLSWYFPLAGVPITVLANFGVLPPWPLFAKAAYIGCALQAVLTSLALAARVKVMGDHLAGLNAQLSGNVVNLEHALENAKEAREAAQRATKAKDDFLATMSHELRTPLNAIINVPQGLLDDFVERRTARCSACHTEFTLEPHDQLEPATACTECGAQGTLVLGASTDYVGEPAHTARFLRKIERAGHHLLDMVDEVLDFSKMEAGRLELHWGELELGSLIRDVADAMSEPARQKGLKLELELPVNALQRPGDPVRLKQVLLNLVSNAIKFTEGTGAVVIGAHYDATSDADVVCVRDQGIGIAPEHHERVFAGFEQVHQGPNRQYGGTGLGLSISRKLVRMHGGELSVESSLGAGSTFTMRLPRARQASAAQ